MAENVYNMLISHTNSHDIRDRSTLKDVQCDFSEQAGPGI